MNVISRALVWAAFVATALMGPIALEVHAPPTPTPSVAVGSPGAVSEPAPVRVVKNDLCDRLIEESSPPWRVQGWQVQCVEGLPSLGETHPHGRFILIRRDRPAAEMTATIAHEWGHAQLFDAWDAQDRDHWAGLLRMRDVSFYGASLRSPAELWAETNAYCGGYVDESPPDRRVSCVMREQQLDWLRSRGRGW